MNDTPPLPIVSRKDALARKQVYYFTGKPCKNGHIGQRLVSNWTCVACHQDKKNTPLYKQYAHEYGKKYRAVPSHQARSRETDRIWRSLHGKEFLDKHKKEYNAKRLGRYHTLKQDSEWLAERNRKRREYELKKWDKLKKDPVKYAEIREARQESWKLRYAKLKENYHKYREFLASKNEATKLYYEQIKGDSIKYQEFLGKRKYQYEKLKEDAIKYQEFLNSMHQRYKKRYAELKKDPLKYGNFLVAQRQRGAENYKNIKKDAKRLEKLRSVACQRAKKERSTLRGKLDYNLRRDIWQALKGVKSRRKWQTLVGWTVDDLIVHLESQFTSEMTWENYGKFWEIDHIRPKSSFTYKAPEDTEFLECWALKNLRPLSKTENRKKSNKLDRWDIIAKIPTISSTECQPVSPSPPQPSGAGPT